jgi:hypothetical protein
MVPETPVIFNQFIRLIAREDFINFNRGKSFGSSRKTCLFIKFCFFNDEEIGLDYIESNGRMINEQ